MIFSVTYYLELHNATSTYYVYYLFTSKCQTDCLNIIEHEQLYLVKNYMNK